LERNQAVILLKEMISSGLAVPSIVTLEKTINGKYALVLKDEFESQAIKQFVAERHLAIKMDTQKGWCTIYRP
jgi:hypothetical protein